MRRGHGHPPDAHVHRLPPRPGVEIAKVELGNEVLSNSVALTGVVGPGAAWKAIEARVPGKAKEINRRAFERGGGVEISGRAAALNRHRLGAHGGLYQA